MDDLTARATLAYLRRRATAGQDTNPGHASGIREHDGRRYVVLIGPAGQLLAVYRVHNDGTLKWMVRNWPKEIEPVADPTPRTRWVDTFPDRDDL